MNYPPAIPLYRLLPLIVRLRALQDCGMVDNPTERSVLQGIVVSLEQITGLLVGDIADLTDLTDPSDCPADQLPVLFGQQNGQADANWSVDKSYMVLQSLVALWKSNGTVCSLAALLNLFGLGGCLPVPMTKQKLDEYDGSYNLVVDYDHTFRAARISYVNSSGIEVDATQRTACTNRLLPNLPVHIRTVWPNSPIYHQSARMGSMSELTDLTADNGGGDQIGGIQSSVTLTSTCVSSCQTSCQSSTEYCASCETSCQVRCESGCQLTSEAVCSYNCQFSCQISCQGGCEAGCESFCQMACQTGCETICQAGCQTACETTVEDGLIAEIGNQKLLLDNDTGVLSDSYTTETGTIAQIPTAAMPPGRAGLGLSATGASTATRTGIGLAVPAAQTVELSFYLDVQISPEDATPPATAIAFFDASYTVPIVWVAIEKTSPPQSGVYPLNTNIFVMIDSYDAVVTADSFTNYWLLSSVVDQRSYAYQNGQGIAVGPIAVDILITRASSPTASDGSLAIYLNGLAVRRVGGLSNYYYIEEIDSVMVGASTLLGGYIDPDRISLSDQVQLRGTW